MNTFIITLTYHKEDIKEFALSKGRNENGTYGLTELPDEQEIISKEDVYNKKTAEEFVSEYFINLIVNDVGTFKKQQLLQEAILQIDDKVTEQVRKCLSVTVE